MLEFGRDVSNSSNSTAWHHGFLSLFIFPLCIVNSEARRSGSFHFYREYFNNLLCGWLLFCFCLFFFFFFFFSPVSYVTDHWFHSSCICVSDVPVSSLKGWTVLSHFILMISFWRSSLQRKGTSFSTVHKEISLVLQCSFYISVA